MNKLITSILFALTTIFTGCAYDTADEVGDTEAAVTGRPYFELYQSSGDYRFRLKAANHQIILSSQAYASRTTALNGILSVLDNGENVARYELRESSNGQHYFVLEARNGRTIGTSEMYSTAYNAQRGADAVKRNVGEYLDWLANRTGARFQTFQGGDDRWYFNLYARNGEVVLSSEGYSSEEAALNGTFLVSFHAADARAYDIREAVNGEFYFNVLAANGEVIATSETYVSESNAKRAADAIVALVPTVEML